MSEKMNTLKEVAEILREARPSWDVEVCPEHELGFLTVTTASQEFTLSIHVDDEDDER